MALNPDDGAMNEVGRRDFLKVAAAIPAALAAAQYAVGAAQPTAGAASADAASKPPAAEAPKLPQIRLGRHSISRLIAGNNTFAGGSHLSGFLNRAMREYFTPEQILKTLRRCQEVGVNCWQAVPNCVEPYKKFLAEGGKMNLIILADGDPALLKPLAEAGCIAIAHHGETTDRLFKLGRLDEIHDYLKHVRDAGLLVGVSTHIPDVVDAIESKGWDVDFYMTCVYERHRTAAELEKLLGQVPIPIGEVYLRQDPPRMFKAIRQTKRPCLAFKILAAGRLSDKKEWVEKAFRETFEAIKPTDGVIIGFYDRYSDQAAENAEYVKRFGGA